MGCLYIDDKPKGYRMNEVKMSKTIRNQKTKGFLDKLALQQRTRKLIRAVKNDDFWIEDEEFFVPFAQI